MAISQGQHVPLPESGIPHLTLRTDSITLRNPSEKDGAPAIGTSRADQTLKLGQTDSPSSHQKKPSASSISSVSSAGSKTAAFFNAPNADTAVRPAASTSSSSLHSNPFSSPQKQSIYRPMDVGDGEAMQLGESDDGTGRIHPNSSAGASLARLQGAGALTSSESINELNRASSTNSQGGGRRGWLDFDGKPIMALPSPNVFRDLPLNERDEIEGYGFPSSHNDRQIGGREDEEMGTLAKESTETPLRRAESAAKPSFVQHRKNKLSDAEGDLVESPKTLNFFGSGWSAASPLASAKEGRAAGATLGSPMPSRTTSETHSLYAPSRLPSASAHHPRPGQSMEIDDDAAKSKSSASQMQHKLDIDLPHASARAIFGTQASTIPAAFISPPSPDPPELSTSFAQKELATSTPRSHTSRHTHGPSENVTHSSILPHADLIHRMDEGKSASRLQSQRDIDDLPSISQPAASSSTNQATHEESEDESANRVGPYTVESVLGVGAFSRVVLAKRSRGRPTTAESKAQKGSKGLVALKMLEKEPCRQNERMRVSWVREVEVLKHIIHPFIVRFLFSFSTNKHHVLVLENVEGGELFEYLANDQTELAQREWLVRRIFGELANAVGWMHSIHLVHRDIKLENIILTQSLRNFRPLTPNNLPSGPLIKLSDFGLSRFVDPSSPLLETRCGSEEYAAPELIIGKRYDGRQTDVWAMGVVLYALLSGSLPFLTDMSGSVPGPGMTNAREGAHPHQNDAKARKAHLLRIAKGDLRWPAQANDTALDTTDPNVCPAQHRLITPPARLLVAKLLRRDAAKRAAAWDVWDESWMLQGSFNGLETSAQSQGFIPPTDPRSFEGQTWLSLHARVRAGAPDVVRDD